MFFIPLIVGFFICSPTIFSLSLRTKGPGPDDYTIYKNIINSPFIEKVPYQSLIQRIEHKKISKIYYSPDLNDVLAKEIQNDELYPMDYSVTHITPLITNQLVDISTKNNVESVFISVPTNPVLEVINVANNLVFPILLFSILFSVLRTMFKLNNSNSNINNPFSNLLGNKDKDSEMIKTSFKRENISIASFGGSPEILEECMEIVSYIKNSTDYKNAGAKIPKGILLEGPPGTGKTLLAKAIASETNAHFISISASEFVEIFVGMGAAKIRELFKRAKENKPCIVFIDEIDAVGKKRGGNSITGNDEREQTLNQLLSEMDGFMTLDDVLVIAATNMKESLDPALLRPGRFDRIINVPLPDRISRKAILQVHSRGKKMYPKIDYDLLSDLTAGFSGAEIQNILNEAAILTARRGETIILEDDILDSIEKSSVGLIKRTETRSDEAIRRVAIHEIGHAFLCFKFPEYFDLKKVSIKGTYNGAGGYTIFTEKPDIQESGLYTKDILNKRLIVAMGGKAAEEVFYGEDKVSVGASQDLKEANKLARQMVGYYGMGKELVTFSLVDSDKMGETNKNVLDQESDTLVYEAYKFAKLILTKHRGEIEELVERIMEKKVLTDLEFYAVEGLIN